MSHALSVAVLCNDEATLGITFNLAVPSTDSAPMAPLTVEFEHLIGQEERRWQANLAESPGAASADVATAFPSTGPPLSMPDRRYAQSVLAEIDGLRREFAAAPESGREQIIAALRLGLKLGEDRYKYGSVDRLTTGTKVTWGGRKGGQATSVAHTAAATDFDQRVARAAVRYRRDRPYHRAESSTRELARVIATELREKTGRVRASLRRSKMV